MTHPYRGLSDSHFWTRSVSNLALHEVDPLSSSTLRIAQDDRIATMGSCFAQHISRRLMRLGFGYFVPEAAPPGLDEAEAQSRNYGIFSARYGNVYTVRQALQLFQRAWDGWEPEVEAWEQDGSWFDPYRPQIEPGGFPTLEELRADRRVHLEAVRRVFSESTILVFTLGLTEAWRSRVDGAVFPVVPGSAAGEFDDKQHEFVNFRLAEITRDLSELIERTQAVNPGVRLLLTVSPVPLLATHSDQHVLSATTYSKSVLRVAADEVSREFDDVHYFPSYEIITGVPSGNRYFEDDLRSVNEAGVEHVMRVFQRHYVEGEAAPQSAEWEASSRLEMQRTSEVICDEDVLER